MWVEQRDPTLYQVGQRIAVVYDQNSEKMEGTFDRIHHNPGGGYTVFFTTTDDRAMSASDMRKFYRWVEDKPEDSVNQLDVHVDQSALRLRKPDPTAAEVEAAEAALVERIERLERGVRLHAHVGEVIANQQPPAKKAAAVVVGSELFTIREGEHMRVWWEDGRLHTEHVQGESE
jgi:hypothetical protein